MLTKSYILFKPFKKVDELLEIINKWCLMNSFKKCEFEEFHDSTNPDDVHISYLLILYNKDNKEYNMTYGVSLKKLNKLEYDKLRSMLNNGFYKIIIHSLLNLSYYDTEKL